ncbi:MAG TPA: alpha/beta hydrolase domain-containing protein [Pirellulaceae bacterium]|nr:alpha/beta hydrolase domain-containing protein [Pirellulaceae bacterium]
MIRSQLALAWLLVLVGAAAARAEVTKLEIRSRTPYADGRKFGEVGAYETLRGKAYFAVDPQVAANRTVIDLELAPRNAAGKVEFSTDVEILAPVEPKRGRGALLYDVNNRGNKLALGQFNSGADEFLMRQGFVVVWSGWIAETAPGGGRLRLSAPVATEGGRPITGVVRAEVVVDAPADRANLGQWANQGSYEPTERGESEAVLTWRLRESDARAVIPRSQWKFEKRIAEADGERGQLPLIDLVVAGGLKPGYIYEVVYEAQGPIVQGLGLAGIRDLVSFLKYDSSINNPLSVGSGTNATDRNKSDAKDGVKDGAKDGAKAGAASDADRATRRSTIKHAYGFGVSQSGRCLRMFLYDGFNVDERGRAVFDGLMPHVAGAGLGFFNHRFASPTRHNAQHDNHLYPADMFPFTYGDEHDPLTGRDDGILRRSRAAGVVPKVMHTQSSSEYWHRSGSLVHTDPLGKRDAELPAEVRVYCFGGTQHGPGSGVPGTSPGNGQLIGNPADYRPLIRALLVALDAWVREGTEPPASVYPRIADGTLVDWRESASGWRGLPGVRYPDVIQRPELLDRGSDFLTLRRTTIEPPQRRGEYVVRVPGYADDNRERGSLDLPCVAVPVATFTSWNLRSRSIGAENELLSLAGGYIPLARTADQRAKTGDPRPALLERYRDFDDYLAQHRRYTEQLIQRRYLLSEELPSLQSLAEKNRKLFEQ